MYTIKLNGYFLYVFPGKYVVDKEYVMGKLMK